MRQQITSFVDNRLYLLCVVLYLSVKQVNKAAYYLTIMVCYFFLAGRLSWAAASGAEVCRWRVHRRYHQSVHQ